MAMRAILFDKDGTLLNFEATWAPLLKRVALEAAGGDELQAARLLDAGGYDHATSRFRSGSVIAAGTSRDVVRLWYPRLFGAAYEAKVEKMDRLFAAHGSTASVAIDGAAAALDLLAARRFVMGVATNDATAAAVASLTATGLIRNLPYVFGYEVGAKPGPDMVHAFCAAARLQPADVIVVGDNAHDITMAKVAGAGLAIGVTSGNSAESDLVTIADVVLGSIRDLPRYLAELAERRPAV